MFKKRKSSDAMTLAEILVATFIAGIVLTGVTMIYFYSSRASLRGAQKSEAQQALNTSMDQILRDLRMVGADVSSRTCGISKEKSIDKATINTLNLYGNFDDENDPTPSGPGMPTPTIEYVRYYVENNTALIREIRFATPTGPNSWVWGNRQERVLIGKKPTGQSKIKVKTFELKYVTETNLTPHPVLTPGEEELIKRVDMEIEITTHDGVDLIFGTNSSGTLRNFQQ